MLLLLKQFGVKLGKIVGVHRVGNFARYQVQVPSSYYPAGYGVMPHFAESRFTKSHFAINPCNKLACCEAVH